MTSITPTYHVHIDPRHSIGWTRPEDAAEQAMFSRLAEEGCDDEVRYRLDRAERACRNHLANREVVIREQAI